MDSLVYEEHAPARPLRTLIECYWTLRAGPRAAPHRVLPDGCLDILVDLATGRADVVGIMTRALLSSSLRPVDYLGVRFRPGEAPSFLGIAGRETRDENFALPDVWGAFGRAFAGRIVEARDTATRVRILDRHLCDHAARLRASDHRVRRAVERVQAARGSIDIDTLARDIGISERQLERAFDLHVGLGPKSFARVMRLQALVGEMKRAALSEVSWPRLAAEFGFADQAHLIREVRTLAGVTPQVLLRELSA